MNLSAYFGLTLPVILTCLDDSFYTVGQNGQIADISNIQHCIRKVDNYGAYRNLEKSTEFLRYAASFVYVDHKTNQIYDPKNPANNQIPAINNAELFAMSYCIKQLMQAELEGNRFNIDFATIRELGNKVAGDKTITTARGAGKVLKIHQLVQSELEQHRVSPDEVASSIDILNDSQFQKMFDLFVADTIDDVTLSDLDKAMIIYYTKAFLRFGSRLCSVGLDTGSSNSFQGLTPKQVVYRVINKFKALSDFHGGAQKFRATIADTQTEIVNMRRYINDLDKCVDFATELTNMTPIQPTADATPQQIDFYNRQLAQKNTLQSMFSTIGLNMNFPSNWRPFLMFMAHVKERVSVDSLNKIFNVTLSEEEWNDQFLRMDRYGICGLSFDTWEHSKVEKDNIVLYTNVDEYSNCKDSMQEVLDTVNAYLSSFKEIGEAL